METNTDILNELTAISPVVAALYKGNVFTVPYGYFDTIAPTVIACINTSARNFIPAANEQQANVPDGYFNNLAGAILAKIKASETAADEMKVLSPLLYKLQPKNVYQVPPGYFENVHHEIIDNLANIDAKQELQVLSPLLFTLQSKNIFKIPAGYFDNFPNTILNTMQPQPAKVVAMPRRVPFLKYAVAAMLTGALALGVYKYANQTTTSTPNPVALEAFVESGRSMNDKQFNEALQNLSEADIAKYLEKNSDIADVAVLRNNLDENVLPSQDDYLLDETTLDNYLKEIDKPALKN